MWFSVFAAGVLGGITYPALAVYRTELFPTGNRSRAAGLITAAALVGGIGGLLAMGTLLDHGWPHGRVMALLASAQVARDRDRPALVPRDRPPRARGPQPDRPRRVIDGAGLSPASATRR